MMGMVAAITLFDICLRSHMPVTCAQDEVKRVAMDLQLTRPISIRILHSHPTTNALASQWAWSRRDQDGIGCIADFMPDAVLDRTTIAHEVCHCHLHWRYMTVSGRVEVGGAALKKIEEEAETCATKLTR